MPLVVVCLAWMIGLAVADTFHLPTPLWLLGGVSALLIAWTISRPAARRSLIVAAALLLGGARMTASVPATTAATIWRYNGQKLTLIATVTHQPDRRDLQQRAVVEVSAVESATAVLAMQGQVRLELPPQPELRYGQRLRLTGVLLEPSSSPTFDYRTYLARHNIRSLMVKPQLTILPGYGGSPLLRPLLALNDAARRTTLRLLPEPQASLLMGILLGIQSTIPPDVLQTFSRTGTSHILVISGWNITVVITAVMGLLSHAGIGRRRAAWLALAVLGSYVLFVGATPSVLRAALMGTLVVWADLSGRPTEPWTLLLAACGAMTLLDPNVLWDVGFQLSALATAGLFAFARPLEAWLGRGPLRWRGLAWALEPLTATLAASTLSLPICSTTSARLRCWPRSPMS